MEKTRTVSKTELLDLCKGYAKALDDLAYVVHCIAKQSTDSLIESTRKNVDDMNSRILISLALAKPPIRLVSDQEIDLEDTKWN